MTRKLLFALLLCGIVGFAYAQTAPLGTKNPKIDPKTGRATFTAKMDKTPSAPPPAAIKPTNRPGFRAVMDKKPIAAPSGN